MRAPAALVAIPLLAGSAAGLGFFTFDHVPVSAAGGAAIALLAGTAACLLRQTGDGTVAIAVGSMLAGVSLGAGAAREAYAPTLLTWFEATPRAAAEPVALEGTLRDDAAESPLGVSIVVRVSAVASSEMPLESVRMLQGGVRLSVAGTLAKERFRAWRAGRTVRVTALLRAPAVYLDPGVPDERRALARRGIVLVGSVKSGALVEVLGPGSVLAEAASACRAWARDRIGDAVGRWGRRSSGIATAILLGDRTGLGEDDERRLQEAGTYHVIAISGGNIAILTAILLTALRVVLPARAATAVTIVLLLCYGALVAPAPSVHRAITAAVVYLAARLVDQRGPALNVLATAAVMAVAVSPLSVFDAGFVLSFGATLGILAGVPAIMKLFPQRRRVVRAAAGLLAATVAAEVLLAPIGAALFSRITIAGVVLNFAAIPLMSIVQIGTLIVLAMVSVGPDAASAAGYLVHLAAEGLVESARLVDWAPWLSRDVPPPSWWLLATYYTAVCVAFRGGRPRRFAIIAAGAAGVAMHAGLFFTARDVVAAPPTGTLRVVFLDVGQGDATLVRLPDGRSLLVDAGGFPIPALQASESGHAAGFDIGERIVAPALRALRVRRLDTLVVTHGDPDHIGGARSALRLFGPRAVWEGVPVPPQAESAALAAAAERSGAERRNVVAGDLLRVGAVQIRVLHPPLPEWERQRVRNEDSIVLEVRLGGVSIVLPGDIGREGESAVLPLLEPAPIVVLKAPHHGSATSSTPAFLAALNPSAVIFSAGRMNRFGHPARPVVERYRARGTAMFSTAEDGAVMLDTDGREVIIRGWTGRRWRVAPAQLPTVHLPTPNHHR